MPPARRDPLDRFWEKFDQDEGCWQWRGQTTPNGYGSFFNGERNMCAHRFAYYALVGPIPD